MNASRGYAVGDSIYVFGSREDIPVKGTVTKISSTGQITVSRPNYKGDPVEQRFTRYGREWGSGDSWRGPFIADKADQDRMYANRIDYARDHALRSAWRSWVDDLTRLNPVDNRLQLVTMLQAQLSKLQEEP